MKHESALPLRICTLVSGAIRSRTSVPCVRSVTRLIPNDIAQPISPQITPCGNVMSNGLRGPSETRATSCLVIFKGCHSPCDDPATPCACGVPTNAFSSPRKRCTGATCSGGASCMSPRALSTISLDAFGSLNIFCMSPAACFISSPSIIPASAWRAGSTPISISFGFP